MPKNNEVEVADQPSTQQTSQAFAQLEAMEILAKALARAQSTPFKDITVVRTGDQIILPEGMSYADAHVWLRKKEDAEESVVAVHAEIPCYPLDGMLALSKALQRIYGFTSLAGTPTFFGQEFPPVIVQVPTGVHTSEPAIYGRIQPPTLEGGYLQPVVGKEQKFTISGQVKRKFEKDVERIFQVTREILANSSIYKGQAIMIDLSYLNRPNHEFNPANDAPKFMDLTGVSEDKLILNKGTKFSLTTSIYTLLEQSEACKANGITLKHGALFMGPYGTGKTMTARVIAHKATTNKWTFIYLKQPDHIAHALKLAEQYSPAVVFAEDIDQVTNGERDDKLNNILNTLDGIDTKDKAVITILTTNHPEKINPGILRAGRIDSVIHMDAPDSEAAEKFVKVYTDNGRLLSPDINLEPIGLALAGFVPAFISEAVQRAKRRAIYRHGADIAGKVSEEDLCLAAAELKNHIKMVNRVQPASHAENTLAALNTLLRPVANLVNEAEDRLIDSIESSK